ncbi:MAG: hypothetical protein ACLP29_09605 [Dissulfurispiraceae bacterium]
MSPRKKDNVDRAVFSLRIDKRLIKTMRQLAAGDEVYDYEVVEAAFREYIKKREWQGEGKKAPERKAKK